MAPEMELDQRQDSDQRQEKTKYETLNEKSTRYEMDKAFPKRGQEIIDTYQWFEDVYDDTNEEMDLSMPDLIEKDLEKAVDIAGRKGLAEADRWLNMRLGRDDLSLAERSMIRRKYNELLKNTAELKKQADKIKEKTDEQLEKNKEIKENQLKAEKEAEEKRLAEEQKQLEEQMRKESEEIVKVREEDARKKRELVEGVLKAAGTVVVAGAAMQTLNKMIKSEEEYRNEQKGMMGALAAGTAVFEKCKNVIVQSVYRTLYLDVLKKTYENGPDTSEEAAAKNEKELNAALHSFENPENMKAFRKQMESKLGSAFTGKIENLIKKDGKISNEDVFKAQKEALKIKPKAKGPSM